MEYILENDSRAWGSEKSYKLLKGTRVIKKNYIDEDGGIPCEILDGEHKGMTVLFNICQLKEVI